MNFADFYALMPPDNAAVVAPGTDVSFPQDGPNSGADISRTVPDSFNPAQIGTYQILFEVSVDGDCYNHCYRFDSDGPKSCRQCGCAYRYTACGRYTSCFCASCHYADRLNKTDVKKGKDTLFQRVFSFLQTNLVTRRKSENHKSRNNGHHFFHISTACRCIVA